MVVATDLSLIECLLVDVLVGLTAIESRLRVVKRASGGLVFVAMPAALGIQTLLVTLYVGLVAIAEQLLAIAQNLLEVSEVLLLEQFVVRICVGIWSTHVLLAWVGARARARRSVPVARSNSPARSRRPCSQAA